jgi:hypothetical protein
MFFNHLIFFTDLIHVQVLKKSYQLVYFYKDENTPKGLIEKYYVDENFYYVYDFKSKPDESRWKKELVPYKPFDLKSSQLDKLIKKYLP